MRNREEVPTTQILFQNLPPSLPFPSFLLASFSPSLCHSLPVPFPRFNSSQFWGVLSYDQPRQPIKKQRHYFANTGPPSQGYGFSSGHVWM